MKKPTTISKESVSEYREFVQLRLRKRVLEAIEVVLEEEVDQALGCGSYERAEDRRGYRNGAETRRVTTSVGTRELRVPRARVRDEETGETTEFRSELLPRYARRTREVDEAILGTYLSGANSRRIRKALKPLLGEEHLSKSAVSRVVSRLKERFEEWQNRALSEEVYAIVYLDGFHLKVRMAKRVISVPVLVALGVAPDGHKRLLSLRLAVSEASTHCLGAQLAISVHNCPVLTDSRFPMSIVWKFALSKEGFLSYFLTRSNLWESPRQSRGFTSMN